VMSKCAFDLWERNVNNIQEIIGKLSNHARQGSLPWINS
jgi:hypothetical protein